MNNQPLQWNQVDQQGDVSRAPLSDTSAMGHERLRSIAEATLAEVLKSIGQDCTKQVQSFLDCCETKQEGE